MYRQSSSFSSTEDGERWDPISPHQPDWTRAIHKCYHLYKRAWSLVTVQDKNKLLLTALRRKDFCLFLKLKAEDLCFSAIQRDFCLFLKLRAEDLCLSAIQRDFCLFLKLRAEDLCLSTIQSDYKKKNLFMGFLLYYL